MPEYSFVIGQALELFDENISNRLKEMEPDEDPQKRIVSRVFAAAVVSQVFRSKLINNPVKAIEDGYRDEKFDLSPVQKGLFYVSSLQAKSLADLAKKYLELSDEIKK